MKKLMTLLIAVLLALSLCACVDVNEEESVNDLMGVLGEYTEGLDEFKEGLEP